MACAASADFSACFVCSTLADIGAALTALQADADLPADRMPTKAQLEQLGALSHATRQIAVALGSTIVTACHHNPPLHLLHATQGLFIMGLASPFCIAWTTQLHLTHRCFYPCVPYPESLLNSAPTTAGQQRLLHAIIRLGGFNQVATALRLQCDAAAGRQRAPPRRLSGTAFDHDSLGKQQHSTAQDKAGRSKALPRAQSAPAGHADLVHRVADQVCQSSHLPHTCKQRCSPGLQDPCVPLSGKPLCITAHWRAVYGRWKRS